MNDVFQANLNPCFACLPVIPRQLSSYSPTHGAGGLGRRPQGRRSCSKLRCKPRDESSAQPRASSLGAGEQLSPHPRCSSSQAAGCPHSVTSAGSDLEHSALHRADFLPSTGGVGHAPRPAGCELPKGIKHSCLMVVHEILVQGLHWNWQYPNAW